MNSPKMILTLWHFYTAANLLIYYILAITLCGLEEKTSEVCISLKKGILATWLIYLKKVSQKKAKLAQEKKQPRFKLFINSIKRCNIIDPIPP